MSWRNIYHFMCAANITFKNLLLIFIWYAWFLSFDYFFFFFVLFIKCCILQFEMPINREGISHLHNAFSTIFRIHIKIAWNQIKIHILHTVGIFLWHLRAFFAYYAWPTIRLLHSSVFLKLDIDSAHVVKLIMHNL